MNYELLPYPAIELLFWYLPIEICVILHEKYYFGPKLWREKIVEIYGMQPEKLILRRFIQKNKMLACIYSGVDINVKNIYGRTALHLASVDGNKEIAELLIDKGAEINTKNNNGYTALHSASILGKKEIVELLIDKGAEINAKNNDANGWTALRYASFNGSKEIAELLIDKGAIE